MKPSLLGLVVVLATAFLLLMIPLPVIIFNQIAFPLQLIASQFGEAAIRAADVPVLREGNVLILANITLEVADACSRIRSLISLLTLGIVFGYVGDWRNWARLVITLDDSDGGHRERCARRRDWHRRELLGRGSRRKVFHEFSGWLVFMVAFAKMLFWHRILL